jgi:hypothetical protein
MGANQSSGGDQSERGNAATIKTSYYELLGVDRQAGDDEYVHIYGMTETVY